MNDPLPPETRHQPEPTPEHATPDQARQGFRGTNVLYVLIGGLVLGAIYILSLLLYSASEDDGQSPAQSSMAPAIHRSVHTPPSDLS